MRRPTDGPLFRRSFVRKSSANATGTQISLSVRLEPDLSYQPQIYRANGESIRLPAGTYNASVTRGPEYRPLTKTLHLEPQTSAAELDLQLERWIDPRQFGWYAGEPHLHPEGQGFGMVSRLA